MTQLWSFVAADGEPEARERALLLAARDAHGVGATAREAVEFEPGRWRVKVVLQPRRAA